MNAAKPCLPFIAEPLIAGLNNEKSRAVQLMRDNEIERAHWMTLTLVIWLLACIWLVIVRWGSIHWLALSDTDDNMRLMEVRAWLNGQGWFDLRQYRLNPPEGFNIHWSRLVDLPIAGIILVVKPLFGTAVAERVAIAIAPLLALGAALFGVALASRRLVAPLSFALAAAILLTTPSTMGMFQPTRIDHHGWQLAALAFVLAGLVDTDRRRGGLTVGIASALSLVIGLEMLPYLALAGAAITLRWIWARDEAPRLQCYGIALGGASALGYMVFASADNRLAMCDVLSPVWLSVMVLGGALLVALSWLSIERRVGRLAVALVAGGVIAIFFALSWPHCLGRPESVSPELQRLWLDQIREARPIYRQEWKLVVATLSVPVLGLLGMGAAIWINRRDAARLVPWLITATLALCGVALLFFQMRAAPAAQLLAIPGCVMLIWIALPRIRASRHLLVRALGTVALFFVGSGLFIQLGVNAVPDKAESPRVKSITKAADKAGASCSTIPSMAPLNRLPATTIMTMVDLGPRLITLTHHSAIAGPYHRNGAAILDMHHAYDGTPDNAHAIARKHGATLLLICPGFAESTVYRARSPKGFYAQLEAGKVPAWLTPVPLPKRSPFRLWRIAP